MTDKKADRIVAMSLTFLNFRIKTGKDTKKQEANRFLF